MMLSKILTAGILIVARAFFGYEEHHIVSFDQEEPGGAAVDGRNAAWLWRSGKLEQLLCLF